MNRIDILLEVNDDAGPSEDLSTLDHVKVKKDNNKYKILFDSKEFDHEFDNDKAEELVNRIKKIFLGSKALEDYEFYLKMFHNYEGQINIERGIKILTLSSEFRSQEEDELLEDIESRFHYILSSKEEEDENKYNSMMGMAEYIAKFVLMNLDEVQKSMNETKNKLEPFENFIAEDIDDYEYLNEDEVDIFTGEKIGTAKVESPLNELTVAMNSKNKKAKKTKIKVIGTSRCVRASKKPKKSYNRHGLLVVSSKKAIEKDERTVKAFLKDFIPGDEKWKKDFRKDLLKRWMRVYVISDGKLKKLEKEYQKKKNPPRKNRSSKNLEKFANNMSSAITRYSNDFYNPKK